MDLEQLHAHAQSLEYACRELDSAGGRLKRMLARMRRALARMRRAVAGEVAQEGAAVVVGEIVAGAMHPWWGSAGPFDGHGGQGLPGAATGPSKDRGFVGAWESRLILT